MKHRHVRILRPALAAFAAVATWALATPARAQSLNMSAPTNVSSGSNFSVTATYSGPNPQGVWVSMLKNGTQLPGAYASYTWYGSEVGPASVTFFSWTSPYGLQTSRTVSVAPKVAQAAVSSQAATVAFGTPFAPSYSGGSGSGNWQFVIGGYTNVPGDQGRFEGGAGTILEPQGVLSTTWTAPHTGTFSFWIRKYGDSAYNMSDWAGPYTLTVTTAPQAAPAVGASQSFAYGNTHTATASGGGGQGPLQWERTGGTASGGAIHASTGVVSATSSGTVIVRARWAGNGNYNPSPWSGEVAIAVAQRPITITRAGSKTYNGNTTATGASASVTSGSLASGDSISYSFGATSSANAGSYAITVTPTITNAAAPTSRTGSYAITYAGNYTIAQASQPTPSITSGSSVTYGSGYTATASGGAGTGAYSWSLGSGSTAPGAAVNASSGAVSFSGAGIVRLRVQRLGDTNHHASSWSSDFTLTVNPRPITITRAGSKTYDGNTTATGASASITSGSLASGDSISYSFGATSSAAVGSYAITVTPTITNASAPTNRTASYSISYAGTYTITKAEQGAPTVAGLQSFTYGTTHTASASGGGVSGVGQGPLQWERTGGSATGGTINASTGLVSAASSGTVTVRARWSGNENHNASPWSNPVDVQVNQRPITITRAGTKTYNGNTTATGASASITSGSLASGDSISYSYGATSSADAGSYAITVTPTITNAAAPTTRTGSYSITYAGNYTINKATQATLTLNAATSQTYNATQALSTSGGSGTGAVSYAIVTQSSAGVASLSGATLTAASGTGWVDVRATKATETNFLEATSNTVRVTLGKATQSITFASIPAQIVGDPAVTLSASSSVGLPVSFSVVGGSASVSGSTLTLGTTPGNVTVRAVQGGNANYAAATPVDRTFRLWGLDEDADGDGMSNGWERAHGLNPFDPGDASLDPDGDGVNNLDEYNLRSDPNQPDQASTHTVTVRFSAVAKGTGTLTLAVNGQSYLLNFPGTSGDWREPGYNTQISSVLNFALQAEVGKDYSVSVSNSGLTDFVVRVNPDPEQAANLGVAVECNEAMIEALTKSEIQASGNTFTVRALLGGSLPFAAMDVSRFEKSREISFGFGVSRGGRSLGRVIFRDDGWFFRKGGVTIVRGAALDLADVRKTATRFQAKLPAGYVDVRQTHLEKTIRYFPPGNYTESGGLFDFTGATPIAAYSIQHTTVANPPDTTDPRLLFHRATGLAIARTVGTTTTILECETAYYGAIQLDYGVQGPPYVTFWRNKWQTVSRMWPWRDPQAPRLGLVRFEADTEQTVTTVAPSPPQTSQQPISIKIRRYLGAAESSSLGSYEEGVYPIHDYYLQAKVSHTFGEGSDAVRGGGRSSLPYTWNGSQMSHPRLVETDAKGANSVTDFYTYGIGIAGNSGNNLEGQGTLAYGEPKRVIHTFGDDLAAAGYPYVISETNPITTFTYHTDPIDGRVMTASSITRRGATQLNRTDFTYAAGSFNGRPTLTTTATAYAAAGSSLTTVSRSYSRRVADLDFRGKPISVVRPDGTKSSYVYQRGTYNPASDSWTAGASGPDLLIAEFHGKAGSGITSWNGAPVDPLDLDPARSTVSERIVNAAGWTLREASYVFTDESSFTRLTAEYAHYDAFGQLLQKADEPFVNGATTGRILYTATYEGFRKVSETDATGVTTTFTYDSYGRLEFTIRAGVGAPVDPYYVPESRTKQEYDAIGRVKKQILSSPAEAQQLVTEFEYDTANRIRRQIAPGGYVTTFDYPAVNQYAIGRTTTALGNNPSTPGTATSTELIYRDGRKKSVSGTAVAEVSYTYAYNAAGNLTTTETLVATGRTTKTTADWLGRVVTIETPTWAAGGAAGTPRIDRNVYNSVGQLVASEATQGASLLAPRRLRQYDSFGRLYREADDTNNTFNPATGAGIEPASDANVVEHRAWYEQKTIAWLDTSAPISTGSQWYLCQEQLTWPYAPDTASGLPDRSAMSKRVSLSSTQITGLTDPVAAHSVVEDMHGNITQSVLSVDRATRRTTTETFLTGSTQRVREVTSNGLPIDSRNAQGHLTRSRYDGLGRLVAVRDARLGALDPVNGWTDYTYIPGTAMVESVTGPDDRITTYGYDHLGRQNVVFDPAGKASRSRYDDAGRVTHVWGDTPNPVKYVYNALGQRTGMYTYRTTFAWNTVACPTAAFDAGGDLTQWTYHAPTGLLETKTDAAGRSAHYRYDALGRTTRRTDKRGWVTDYLYYPVNANFAVGEFPGALKTIDYRGIGGTAASDPAGTPDVTYTYDRRGRVKTVSEGATLGTRTFRYYEAWADGSPTQTRDSSLALRRESLSSFFGSQTIDHDLHFGTPGVVHGAAKSFQYGAHATYYTYDDRLRLATVADGATTPYTYSYVAESNLIDTVAQVTGPGAYTYFRDYDYRSDSHRLSTLKHAWSGIAAAGVETRLTYNTLGLRETEKTRGANLMAQLGRSAHGSHADFAYTDRMEVQTSARYDMTATWDVGALITGTQRGFQYDPIGNRTADHAGDYTIKTYGTGTPPSSANEYLHTPYASGQTFDENGNLLTSGTKTFTYDGENRLVTVADGASSWTYRYDHQGRRVSKSGTGVPEKRFLYDGWNLVAELNASGVVTRRFVWGLDVSGSTQGAGGVGGLLAIVDGANTYRPIYDASHNVIGLYDQGGNTAAAYEYDPFGNVTKTGGAYAASNPFRFSTKYTDTETGLIYYGHRYYDPLVGRFINRDPIEEEGGLNLYGFCGNDGVNRWDMLGLSGSTDTAFDNIRRHGSPGPRFEAILNENGQLIGVRGDPNPQLSTLYGPNLGSERIAIEQELSSSLNTVGASMVERAYGDVVEGGRFRQVGAGPGDMDPDWTMAEYSALASELGWINFDNLSHERQLFYGRMAVNGLRMEAAFPDEDSAAFWDYFYSDPMLMRGPREQYDEAFASLFGAGHVGLNRPQLVPRARIAVVTQHPKIVANSTRGWTVGQPINNLTKDGNVPSWGAVRARYWKNKAAAAKPGEFSARNISRMRRGLAPQQVNPRTGRVESKELHHTPAQRDGGLFDVQEVWPDQHAAVDPFRRVK